MKSYLALLGAGLIALAFLRINIGLAKEEGGLKKSPTPVVSEKQNYLSIPPVPDLPPTTKSDLPSTYDNSPTETYLITYYSCSELEGTSACITYYGKSLVPGMVANNGLPEGTNITIEGLGLFTVGDRGGGLGERQIDVYVTSRGEALERGVEYRKVRIFRNR